MEGSALTSASGIIDALPLWELSLLAFLGGFVVIYRAFRDRKA